MGAQAYEVYVKKATPWWKFITSLLFSNLGLFGLVVGYAVGGAHLFMWLEKGYEDMAAEAKLLKTLDINDTLNYLKYQFWLYGTNIYRYNFTYDEFKDAVLSDMSALETFVMDAYDSVGYDTTMEYDRRFVFDRTLLFVITIMATIGYGNITPKTAMGQLAVIPFAIIGIPLLLMFLAKIGDFMAITFRWIYSRVLCRWCRARRRDSELPPDVDRREYGIMKDSVGKERYMPTDMVKVPIMVNLILIFFFIFIGALMFTFSQNLDPSSAAYFVFVTLTTIGFGDITPEDSYPNWDTDWRHAVMLVVTNAYIIFGIALLSMCLNLMQEQIIDGVSDLVAKLGGKSDSVEVVKYSKEGKVIVTPITGKEVKQEDMPVMKKNKRQPLALIPEEAPPPDPQEDIEKGPVEEQEEEAREQQEEAREEEEEKLSNWGEEED